MHTMNTAVATYATQSRADDALRHLQTAHFPMRKVSMFGRDQSSQEHVIGFYVLGRDYSSEERVLGLPNVAQGMKFFGQRETLWGRSWGALYGSALFIIPGLGHVVVLGPLVQWIVDALEAEGRFGDMTVLGVALEGAGIPKVNIRRYEAAVAEDQFMVLAHGTTEEVVAATRLLERAERRSVDQHYASAQL